MNEPGGDSAAELQLMLGFNNFVKRRGGVGEVQGASAVRANGESGQC
jgi:hypothetical protein